MKINLAPKDALISLLISLGLDADVSSRIAEDIVSKQNYKQTSAVYPSAFQVPFQTEGSLKTKVPSITDEIYALIKEHITHIGGININTASREVMQAYFQGLHLDPTIEDEIISFRETNPFVHPADLKNLPSLSENAFLKMQEYITVKSSYFTIISTAHLNDRPTSKEIKAVVKRDTQAGKRRISILYWQER